jgi:hypothetical protein
MFSCNYYANAYIPGQGSIDRELNEVMHIFFLRLRTFY